MKMYDTDKNLFDRKFQHFFHWIHMGNIKKYGSITLFFIESEKKQFLTFRISTSVNKNKLNSYIGYDF